MASKVKYQFLLLALVLIGPRQVNGQFRLPPFDVEVKGSVSVFPGFSNQNSVAGDIERVQLFNIHAAAHWQLNQNIGIGWFYSRSLDGGVYTHLNDGGKGKTSNALLLMNGPDIRISTGRGKKWRPYLSFNYCKMELINDKVGYRLASKANAFGVSIGVMRKLSNKVYLNLIEIGGRVLWDKPYWFATDKMLEVKMGLTINFGKRK